MSLMRLYADVGNSGLLWAVSIPPGWGPHGRLTLDPARTPHQTAADLRACLEATGCPPEDLVGAALVSSNPRMTEPARQVLAALAPDVAIMGQELRSDLSLSYDQPDQFGQDRLAAVEGARRLRGAPVIVITCGTCLTAQALTDEDTVLAGGIAPGLSVAVAGLDQAVPHLSAAGHAACQHILDGAPVPATARSTEESLVAGLAAALGGAVQLMASALRQVVPTSAPLLLTGAAADFIRQLLPGDWQVEPLLTLEGLRAVHERYLQER